MLQGYVDDKKNTDNAWIETAVINFHQNDKVNHCDQHLDKDVNPYYAWYEVSEMTDTDVNQKRWLHDITQLHHAHW